MIGSIGIVNLKDIEVPFFVVEAIDTVKDYFGITDNTRNLIALAEKIEEIELPDGLAEIILDDLSTIPAVYNALSSTVSGDIVEKTILLMLDRLVKDNKVINYLSTRMDVADMLAEVEEKLWVKLPNNLDDRLATLIVGGELNLSYPTEVPDYSNNIILALTHIENVIKGEYPNINQAELNAVLRRAGGQTYDVDSFGEADEEEDDFFDEDADDRTKTHKAIRNGKVVVIKKRKKRMNSATRRKIARAMKKVKKIIKPSTIRKMIKSRKIAAKKGLIGD